MSMQRSRHDRFREHPVPLTWELPVLAALVGLLIAAMTPLVVQGLACWLSGAAFAWPTGQTPAALVGLAQGRFGVGLAQASADRLPSDPVLWIATAVAEVSLVAGVVLVTCWMRAALGLSGHRGLATAAQARAALGAAALRRRAAVVRPDLYGSRRATRLTGSARSVVAGEERPMGRPSGRTHRSRGRFHPHDVGWRLGRVGLRRKDLWVPYDRTTCAIGPQGSGKTLDVLVPALLDAPGAALVTLTKPDDLFLTLAARQEGGRPVAVLDPFDLAPGVPELVWDPIIGCEDSMLAERRAKAFAAGTVKGAAIGGGDQAARFYAGECAKVLQAYFHAAAIGGLGLEVVLTWVANPHHHPEPEEILRTNPGAAPLWDGLLRGALQGDERTAGNTITTVQQALALFFQADIRRRCVPSPGRPATDLTDLIRAGGTIYLLGREDPYASASPLMTAVTEQILDTAKQLGETAEQGRLCPPFLACLDELPSTAPVPTLATRMANERALGLSFLLAAQTWRQLVVCYGEDEARTIYGLSNNLVVFGGGKDIHFYRELSDLIGQTTLMRASHTRHGHGTSRSWSPTEVPVLQPGELRAIPDRQALVLSETREPIIATLDRCIENGRGAELLSAQHDARRDAWQALGRRSETADSGGDARRLGLPR